MNIDLDHLVMVVLSALVVLCWFAAPSMAIGVLWVTVSGACLVLFASLPKEPIPVARRV